VHAIVAYTNWLKDLENKTPRSFRLGSKLYSEKFDLDIQSSYSADTIFKRQSIIKELHEKMFRLADNLAKIYEINSQAV
jgi:hypothetical protein